MCSMQSCVVGKLSAENECNENEKGQMKENKENHEKLFHEKEYNKIANNNDNSNVMYLDIDDFLEEIGAFGRAQHLLLVVFVIMIIPAAYQVLVMFFIGANPPWRCAQNQTECDYHGVFSIGDEFYDARCEMSRKSWEYTEPSTYSIVTEVKFETFSTVVLC